MSRSESFRKARIFVQDRFCGILEETEDGYRFTYDSDYYRDKLPAVSLTLPLREEPYTSAILFPYFDGLLPEGYLLGLTEKIWKLDSADRFGLLLVACRDCPGDTVILPEEVDNPVPVPQKNGS